MLDLRSALASLDLRTFYDALQKLPAGAGGRVFDTFAGLYVPHAARLGFHVQRLSPTSITATMPDRRRNRNHLASLHAMALAHLAEFTSGVLLLYAVGPDGYRTILREYSIEYLAKARGTITAKASFKRPKGSLDKKDIRVKVELVDAQGTVVARAEPVWRVGKKRDP